MSRTNENEMRFPLQDQSLCKSYIALAPVNAREALVTVLGFGNVQSGSPLMRGGLL